MQYLDAQRGFTKEDKTSFNDGINELEVVFFNDYDQDHVMILGDVWVTTTTYYTQTYFTNCNSTGLSD